MIYFPIVTHILAKMLNPYFKNFKKWQILIFRFSPKKTCCFNNFQLQKMNFLKHLEHFIPGNSFHRTKIFSTETLKILIFLDFPKFSNFFGRKSKNKKITFFKFFKCGLNIFFKNSFYKWLKMWFFLVLEIITLQFSPDFSALKKILK